MNAPISKIMELSEAVGRFVTDGCHISIGGFTLNRNPMAAVYEIIRQKIRGLHLYAHSNGQGVDELVGAGCVSDIEVAYAGTGRFASTCIRFKQAAQQGVIRVEDYSNYQMTLRFTAGAMGVPFLPTRSGMETDIARLWGFSADFRRGNDRIPDKKLCIIDNPFGNWAEASRVALVPAINPDVTIIHVQQADAQGTVRMAGLTFADIEQAKAARHLIVTCEEVVAPEVLREDPDRNHIPFFFVDAVVPVPWGAYPTACYRCYDYDPVYLSDYRTFATDDNRWAEYLDTFVFGCETHAALLERVGRERLTRLRADARTGYAPDLDRR